MRNFRNYLLAALSFTFAFASCTSEPRSFEEEVRHVYRNDRGFMYIKIPPALLTLALNMIDDKDMADFFGDARQVGIITFSDEFSDNESNELVKNLEEMLTRYGFEYLIRISDSGKLISMKIKESNGKVTDLVTIVSENPGPVTAITLSGEIDVQSIVRMASELDYNKLLDISSMGRR
jgi:hypothetical protein